MERFSPNGFLGLAFPGIILIFGLNGVLSIYHFCPLFWVQHAGLIDFGLFIALAIIVGAFLSAANFWMLDKWKSYFSYFKLCTPVIHYHCGFNPKYEMMNKTLNKQAKVFFDRKIFYLQRDFSQFPRELQNELSDMHEQFFDRMYYILDHARRLEPVKTSESLSFLFQHNFLTGWIIAAFELLFMVISRFRFIGLSHPGWRIEVLVCILICTFLLINLQLARFYRQQMIHKFFWVTYTYLNKGSDQK